MSDRIEHPRDDLQLLLDDRLPAERHADVRAHIASCPECSREVEALKRLKAAIRQDLPRHDVPPDVSERVLTALRAEAGAAEGVGTDLSTLPRRALVIGGATLAAAAVAALLFLRRRERDPIGAAAEDFARFQSDRLEVELRTDDPAALERFFATRSLGFPTRVFDFGMMGFRLVGGSVVRIGDSASALFAYQRVEGGRLVCQMYRGTTSDLPPAEQERVVNQIRLRVYSRGSVTLVFWQEDTVVCVLASDGDPGAAIDLAAAKAQA